MELLRRGYAVFMVVTSSQPKFTLAEIVADVHRAVRFIRHHGRDHFGIDPDRIGVTGASAFVQKLSERFVECPALHLEARECLFQAVSFALGSGCRH